MKRKVFKTRKLKFGLFSTTVSLVGPDKNGDGKADFCDVDHSGGLSEGDTLYIDGKCQDPNKPATTQPSPQPNAPQKSTQEEAPKETPQSPTQSSAIVYNPQAPVLGAPTGGSAESSVTIDDERTRAERLLASNKQEGFQEIPEGVEKAESFSILDLARQADERVDLSQAGSSPIQITYNKNGLPVRVKLTGSLGEKANFDPFTRTWSYKPGKEGTITQKEVMSVILDPRFGEPGFESKDLEEQLVYLFTLEEPKLKEVDGEMTYVPTRDAIEQLNYVTRGKVPLLRGYDPDPYQAFEENLTGPGASDARKELEDLGLNDRDVWKIVWQIKKSGGMKAQDALKLIKKHTAASKTTDETIKEGLSAEDGNFANGETGLTQWRKEQALDAKALKEARVAIEKKEKAGGRALEGLSFEKDFNTAYEQAKEIIEKLRLSEKPEDHEKAEAAAYALQEKILAEKERVEGLVTADSKELERLKTVNNLYKDYIKEKDEKKKEELDKDEKKKKELEKDLKEAYTTLSKETQVKLGLIEKDSIVPERTDTIRQRQKELKNEIKDQKTRLGKLASDFDTFEKIGGFRSDNDAYARLYQESKDKEARVARAVVEADDDVLKKLIPGWEPILSKNGEDTKEKNSKLSKFTDKVQKGRKAGSEVTGVATDIVKAFESGKNLVDKFQDKAESKAKVDKSAIEAYVTRLQKAIDNIHQSRLTANKLSEKFKDREKPEHVKAMYEFLKKTGKERQENRAGFGENGIYRRQFSIWKERGEADKAENEADKGLSDIAARRHRNAHKFA